MFNTVLNTTRQGYQQHIIAAEFLLAHKRFSSQKIETLAKLFTELFKISRGFS